MICIIQQYSLLKKLSSYFQKSYVDIVDCGLTSHSEGIRGVNDISLCLHKNDSERLIKL